MTTQPGCRPTFDESESVTLYKMIVEGTCPPNIDPNDIIEVSSLLKKRGSISEDRGVLNSVVTGFYTTEEFSQLKKYLNNMNISLFPVEERSGHWRFLYQYRGNNRKFLEIKLESTIE
jgi:hypothetical protein